MLVSFAAKELLILPLARKIIIAHGWWSLLFKNTFFEPETQRRYEVQTQNYKTKYFVLRQYDYVLL